MELTQEDIKLIRIFKNRMGWFKFLRVLTVAFAIFFIVAYVIGIFVLKEARTYMAGVEAYGIVGILGIIASLSISRNLRLFGIIQKIAGEKISDI
ncbi:hypothetical protein ES708_17377 [subsurface metagenome]